MYFATTGLISTRISPNLPLAVVASEDQKFPEHWGFDVEAIEKAYELNQHSHRVHGASTISQQVAKNLYLWSGRSYFRKGARGLFHGADRKAAGPSGASWRSTSISPSSATAPTAPRRPRNGFSTSRLRD